MNALETGDSLNIFAYRRIALLKHGLYIYCTKMKPGYLRELILGSLFFKL